MEIARTFIDELPRLLRHGWVTTYEMLLGYLLAIAVAIPLAIAITLSQRFDQFVMPTMLFFQVVPKVAVAPLFLVWFGVGVLLKFWSPSSFRSFESSSTPRWACAPCRRR